MSHRFWPNSAGDISADDESNFCDNSRRQAILQAFQDSAWTSIDVLIADVFKVAICDLKTGLHFGRVSDNRAADIMLAPGDL